jgi:hypothetical protein
VGKTKYPTFDAELERHKMNSLRIKTIVMAMVMAIFTVTLSYAQTVTGAISGQVTDESGAVIAGAQIVAHNIATGVDTKATANETGNYSIRFLPIGRYELTITANGFEAQKFPAFSLEVDQTAKLDAKLKVGAASTTTVVEGSVAPILNTNDASLGLSLTSNQIQNVPLNGRNFSSVTLFIPGAVSTSPTGFTGSNAIERSTQYTGIPNVNGNRAQANNYTLDGIDLNENENNLIAYNPAPDAIQEIKVISSNAPAEYGNVNGGDVISVLKSGTNQFHGNAYAFLQNENLNANSWANNHQAPKLIGPPDRQELVPNPIPINPYTQTQFGGTIGGPILHNKLFFFADYEGARQHTGGITTANVFTAAMRNGDFSALLAPPSGSSFSATQLYNTQNNAVPYVNNQIPIVNPVAKYLFAHPELYPLPNVAPVDGIAQKNFQGPNRTFVVNNQGDLKIEYDPRQADKITGFYSQSDAFDGNQPVLDITFPAQNVYPTKLGGATWVHVFSPSIVNSARVGFTRVVWVQSVPTDPSGQFGLSGNSLVGIGFGAQQYVGFSNQGLGGYISNVGTTANIGSITDNTYSYGDNLTWQYGKHLLSMGIEAIRYQNNYITSNNQGFLGSFTYTGDFTRSPNANVDSATNLGFAPADFVLDQVSSATVQEQGELVGQRQWRAAGFIQDDWKATPKLTLNIGLRYEYNQPWYEVNDKTGNISLTTGVFSYAHSVPTGAPAGSQVCSNRACYNPNYTQFMPRVGFAYQATDRFVIRGGYGATSFFEGNAANQRLTSLPPFIQASQLNEVKPAAATATTPYSPGQPYTVEAGFSTNPANISYANAGGSYGAWPVNIKPAYIQEWSLTTEYALNSATTLQVGYVGEQGQHLIDPRNANQLVVNGDFNSAPLASNPFIGNGTLLVTESAAFMNYNALQAVLRHRASHGLEYTVNYTYGRSFTNSLGNYALGTGGYSYGAESFQNGYDSAADYGPSGYDIKHNLTAIAVYELPFGRGRQFGSGVNHYVDAALGGWSLSSSLVAYSGYPVTLTAPSVSNSNSFGQERPNQYRKLKIVNRTIDNWWGTDPSATPCTGPDNGVCAYGVPANNTFGTARPGTERGPGFTQVDSSLFKDFHITEHQAVGFRADAFNVFNIASYGNPDSGVSDASFGNISNQGTPVRSQERRLQLSLHYNF